MSRREQNRPNRGGKRSMNTAPGTSAGFSRMARHHALAIGGIALLAAGISPAVAQTSSASPSPSPTSPTTLTPTSKQVTFTFAYKRDVQSKTIEIDASQAIPSAVSLQAISVGDLTPSEGARALPYSILSAQAQPVAEDPTLVRLTVTVDLSKVRTLQAGEYTGALRILGPGVTPVSVPVSVSLKSGWPVLAFLVLILGLGVGYLFKLNSDIGAKFRPLRLRYENIRRRYHGLAEKPAALTDAFGDLEEAMGRWDLDTAAAKAEAIEKDLPMLVRMANVIGRARSELVIQSRSQAAFQDTDRLIQAERDRLDTAVSGAWPDPASKEADVRKLVAQVVFVSYMLRTDPKTYEPALRLFVQDRFDEGEEKGKEIADKQGAGTTVGDAMAEVASAPRFAPTPAPSTTGRLRAVLLRKQRGVRTSPKVVFFERILPLAVGAATAAIILAVGFQSQYINKATFGFGGFGDWLALFLWGFVAGVSGKAVSEYAQQVSGARALTV
jgi:hypothetical protein